MGQIYQVPPVENSQLTELTNIKQENKNLQQIAKNLGEQLERINKHLAIVTGADLEQGDES